MIFRLFASFLFSGFWNFEFDVVIAAILHLHVEALSGLHFWSDFPQNYKQGALKSFVVWYWKSARAVNYFRSKKRTAFDKHRCLGVRARFRGPGFESRRGQTFAFFYFIFYLIIMNVISNEKSQNRLDDWIFCNISVFLFVCFCFCFFQITCNAFSVLYTPCNFIKRPSWNRLRVKIGKRTQQHPCEQCDAKGSIMLSALFDKKILTWRKKNEAQINKGLPERYHNAWLHTLKWLCSTWTAYTKVSLL